MATKTYTFTGKASWAKLSEANRDMYEWNAETMKFDKESSTNGRYSIQLEMNSSDYRELKKTGSMSAKHSKVSDDGFDVVRFNRPHEKYNFKGELMAFASGAPKVTDATGKSWDWEKDGLIGNGSEVEVTVSIYDTKYQPGTRLESVKVIDLVPYESVSAEETEEAPF